MPELASAAAVEAARRRDGPEAAGRHIGEATVHAFCLAGTPADLVLRVEDLLARGVRHATFCPPLGPDRAAAVRLLGETILPRFSGG